MKTTGEPRPPCEWCTRSEPTSMNSELIDFGVKSVSPIVIAALRAGVPFRSRVLLRKHTGGGAQTRDGRARGEPGGLRALDDGHRAGPVGLPLFLHPDRRAPFVDAQQDRPWQLSFSGLDPPASERFEMRQHGRIRHKPKRLSWPAVESIRPGGPDARMAAPRHRPG